jgi:hypothetical protein
VALDHRAGGQIRWLCPGRRNRAHVEKVTGGPRDRTGVRLIIAG